MVDSWLVDVPEELIDTLLLDQVCLVGGVGGHLRSVSQARRSQEQRNRFHPHACASRRIGRHYSSTALYTLYQRKRYKKFGVQDKGSPEVY